MKKRVRLAALALSVCGFAWTGAASVRLEDADWMIVDLAGGASAKAYPVAFEKGGEAARFAADDVYKTSKLVLRRIPAGEFWIGEGEGGDITSSPRKRLVKLTEDRYMGVFPVTQRQYELVTGENPSAFKSVKDAAVCPVEMVSFMKLEGADGFFARLQARTGLAGRFALPTEAQWEGACRAGTKTAYFFGSDASLLPQYGWTTNIADYTWKSVNPLTSLHPVGLLKPNPYGLYDLYGNVWEWCRDWKAAYPENPVDADGRVLPLVDPTGPKRGKYHRVTRGGIWNAYNSGWRVNFRCGGDSIVDRYVNTGFRVCFTVAAAKPVSTRLAVDVSGLPKEKAFLGDIVTKRVTERSAVAVGAGAGAYRVSFRRNAKLESEHFQLVMTPGAAVVEASDFRGFMYGTGAFLRSLEYRESGFAAGEKVLAEGPLTPFRDAYFARHFGNVYDHSTTAELADYYEELMLWGVNGITSQVFSKLYLKYAPDVAKHSKSLSIYRDLFRTTKRLDLRLRAPLQSANTTYIDTPVELRAIPMQSPPLNLGCKVCPSDPKGIAWLEKTMNEIVAELGVEYLPDIFSFFPYDEGGCECEKCLPWGGNGYLRMCKYFMEKIRAIKPDAKFLLCTWMFDDEEWALLDQAIKDGFRPDYIMADAHGDRYPRYPLEHDLGGIPIVTFPEISMWGRFPWGGSGAQPLPKRFRRIFDQVKGHVAGFSYYSEGLYEDINKILVQQFYWNDSSPEEVLEAYARYYFPGCDPKAYVRLCGLLEETHELLDYIRDPKKDPKRYEELRCITAEAFALAKEIDGTILPSMRGTWRWRITMCRAELDVEAFKTKVLWMSPRARECLRELIRIYRSDTVPEDSKMPVHYCTRPPLIGELLYQPKSDAENRQFNP